MAQTIRVKRNAILKLLMSNRILLRTYSGRSMGSGKRKVQLHTPDFVILVIVHLTQRDLITETSMLLPLREHLRVAAFKL